MLNSTAAVGVNASADRYTAAGVVGSERAQRSVSRRPEDDDQPQPASLNDVTATAFTCEDSPSLRYMDSLTTYNGEGDENRGRDDQVTRRPAGGAVKRKESLQSYRSELDRSSDSHKGTLLFEPVKKI